MTLCNGWYGSVGLFDIFIFNIYLYFMGICFTVCVCVCPKAAITVSLTFYSLLPPPISGYDIGLCGNFTSTSLWKWSGICGSFSCTQLGRTPSDGLWQKSRPCQSWRVVLLQQIKKRTDADAGDWNAFVLLWALTTIIWIRYSTAETSNIGEDTRNCRCYFYEERHKKTPE